MKKNLKSIAVGFALFSSIFQSDLDAQDENHFIDINPKNEKEKYGLSYKLETENFSYFMQGKLERESKVNPWFYFSPNSIENIEKNDRKVIGYLRHSAKKEIEEILKNTSAYGFYQVNFEESIEDYFKDFFGKRVKLNIEISEDESFKVGNPLFEKIKYNAKFKAFPPSASIKIGNITKVRLEHDKVNIGIERKLANNFIFLGGIEKDYDDCLNSYYGFRTGKTRFGELIIWGEFNEDNEQRAVGMLTFLF